MRRLIGTSWKMNLTATAAEKYCATLRPLIADITDRDLFILPPYTSIHAVRGALHGTGVRWGAQHVHPDDRGAHTGDVSAPMLADLGCTLVEIGHSERRRDYGETDRLVAAQAASIQRWGMTALVCVGEREPDTLPAAMNAIRPQLAVLADVDPARLIVAYEPVWAIGEGARAAQPVWIGEIHQAIHDRLATMHGDRRVPVIYGGSVDSGTAASILDRPGVDGLFVGRSALDPVEFARIAHAGTPSA